ncbi:MAG: DUF192 domain-containing protein [Alphaproteobacteria bacterium]|nr:MAG: DUF192 domain-containing protein [Alphaproteobacteria bacterium]
MMKLMLPLYLVFAGCGEAADAPQTLPERVVQVGTTQVTAQTADDTDERAKGLMFVKRMPADEGMLFVWPEAEERSFWMRNTFIPLDLLYVSRGKVVSIIEGAKPHDETGLPSGKPADMVLEMNAGWVKAHGIRIGDTVTLK